MLGPEHFEGLGQGAHGALLLGGTGKGVRAKQSQTGGEGLPP